MKFLRQTILSVTAVTALTTVSFAGGNILPPKIIPAPIVEPVVSTISPVPFYIGVGTVATFINRDPCPCTPNDPDIEDHRYGIVARIGWDYNQYVGVEARALKTFGNDVFSTTEHYGIYLKPQYHIADQMNVYGLIGYGETTVDYTNGVRSSHNVADGFAYGIGFEYDFGSDVSEGTYDRAFDGQGDQEKGWGLWIDFQHLLSDEFSMHTNLNIITVGVTYDF